MESFKAGITFVVADFAKSQSQLMMMSVSLTGVEKRADRAGKSVTRAGKNMHMSMKTVATTLGVVGGALLSIAGAGAVGLLSAARHASRFEQQLIAVKNIAGATDAELADLRRTAIAAGLATQFSPQEAVEGLRTLAQMGFSAKDSMAALQPALDLAMVSLGQLGVADAAFLASQGVKAFGLTTDQIPEGLDKMVKATNTFAISMKDLPLGMGIIARGAQAMNQSLDESLIAFGLVKNVIPTVERAAGAGAVGMERLTSAKRQAKLESYFNVKAVDAETGKFRDFLDIMVDVTEASKGMTEAQRANALIETFGSRAAGGLNAILTQLTNGIKDAEGNLLKGADAVAYLRNTMKNATGTAAKMREEMFNTFEGQLTLLRGVAESMRVVFGTALAKSFKPFAKFLVTSLTWLTKKFDALPDVVKAAISVVLILAVAVTGMAGAFFLAAAAVAALAVVGAPAIIASLALVTVGIEAVIITMAPFIALAVVAYAAYQSNFAGIRDYVDRVALAFTGLYEVMMSYVDGTATMSDKTASALEKAGLLEFVITAGGQLGKLKQLVVEVGGLLYKFGVDAWDAFAPLAGAVGRLFSAFGSLAGGLLKAFFGLPEEIDGTSVNLDSLSSMLDRLAGFFDVVADRISVMVNNFADLTERMSPVVISNMDALFNELGDTFDVLVNLGEELALTVSELFLGLAELSDALGITDNAAQATSRRFDTSATVMEVFSGLIKGLTMRMRLWAQVVQGAATTIQANLRKVRITIFRVKQGFEVLQVIGMGVADAIANRWKVLGAVMRGEFETAARLFEQGNQAAIARKDAILEIGGRELPPELTANLKRVDFELPTAGGAEDAARVGAGAEAAALSTKTMETLQRDSLSRLDKIIDGLADLEDATRTAEGKTVGWATGYAQRRTAPGG